MYVTILNRMNQNLKIFSLALVRGATSDTRQKIFSCFSCPGLGPAPTASPDGFNAPVLTEFDWVTAACTNQASSISYDSGWLTQSPVQPFAFIGGADADASSFSVRRLITASLGGSSDTFASFRIALEWRATISLNVDGAAKSININGVIFKEASGIPVAAMDDYPIQWRGTLKGSGGAALSDSDTFDGIEPAIILNPSEGNAPEYALQDAAFILQAAAHIPRRLSPLAVMPTAISKSTRAAYLDAENVDIASAPVISGTIRGRITSESETAHIIMATGSCSGTDCPDRVAESLRQVVVGATLSSGGCSSPTLIESATFSEVAADIIVSENAAAVRSTRATARALFQCGTNSFAGVSVSVAATEPLHHAKGPLIMKLLLTNSTQEAFQLVKSIDFKPSGYLFSTLRSGNEVWTARRSDIFGDTSGGLAMRDSALATTTPTRLAAAFASMTQTFLGTTAIARAGEFGNSIRSLLPQSVDAVNTLLNAYRATTDFASILGFFDWLDARNSGLRIFIAPSGSSAAFMLTQSIRVPIQRFKNGRYGDVTSGYMLYYNSIRSLYGSFGWFEDPENPWQGPNADGVVFHGAYTGTFMLTAIRDDSDIGVTREGLIQAAGNYYTDSSAQFAGFSEYRWVFDVAEQSGMIIANKVDDDTFFRRGLIAMLLNSQGHSVSTMSDVSVSKSDIQRSLDNCRQFLQQIPGPLRPVHPLRTNFSLIDDSFSLYRAIGEVMTRVDAMIGWPGPTQFDTTMKLLDFLFRRSTRANHAVFTALLKWNPQTRSVVFDFTMHRLLFVEIDQWALFGRSGESPLVGFDRLRVPIITTLDVHYDEASDRVETSTLALRGSVSLQNWNLPVLYGMLASSGTRSQLSVTLDMPRSLALMLEMDAYSTEVGKSFRVSIDGTNLLDVYKLVLIQISTTSLREIAPRSALSADIRDVILRVHNDMLNGPLSLSVPPAKGTLGTIYDWATAPQEYVEALTVPRRSGFYPTMIIVDMCRHTFDQLPGPYSINVTINKIINVVCHFDTIDHSSLPALAKSLDQGFAACGMSPFFYIEQLSEDRDVATCGTFGVRASIPGVVRELSMASRLFFPSMPGDPIPIEATQSGMFISPDETTFASWDDLSWLLHILFGQEYAPVRFETVSVSEVAEFVPTPLQAVYPTMRVATVPLDLIFAGLESKVPAGGLAASIRAKDGSVNLGLQSGSVGAVSPAMGIRGRIGAIFDIPVSEYLRIFTDVGSCIDPENRPTTEDCPVIVTLDTQIESGRNTFKIAIFGQQRNANTGAVQDVSDEATITFSVGSTLGSAFMNQFLPQVPARVRPLVSVRIEEADRYLETLPTIAVNFSRVETSPGLWLVPYGVMITQSLVHGVSNLTNFAPTSGSIANDLVFSVGVDFEHTIDSARGSFGIFEVNAAGGSGYSNLQVEVSQKRNFVGLRSAQFEISTPTDLFQNWQVQAVVDTYVDFTQADISMIGDSKKLLNFRMAMNGSFVATTPAEYTTLQRNIRGFRPEYTVEEDHPGAPNDVQLAPESEYGPAPEDGEWVPMEELPPAEEYPPGEDFPPQEEYPPQEELPPGEEYPPQEEFPPEEFVENPPDSGEYPPEDGGEYPPEDGGEYPPEEFVEFPPEEPAPEEEGAPSEEGEGGDLTTVRLSASLFVAYFIYHL
jgi:hypothetical protein